jgi:hypothetical protein
MVLICGLKLLISLIITLAAIIALETPQARPSAIL